jgi:hypothetical protein
MTRLRCEEDSQNTCGGNIGVEISARGTRWSLAYNKRGSWYAHSPLWELHEAFCVKVLAYCAGPIENALAASAIAKDEYSGEHRNSDASMDVRFASSWYHTLIRPFDAAYHSPR